MNRWQEDLLNLLLIPVASPEGIFTHLESCARSLGFDHVAYGFQAPYPVTRPKITLLNNYPQHWQERYLQAGYLHSDPTITHGQRCQSPILWSDEVFEANPALWTEVKEHGIRFGWAQSSLERNGAKSLLTLCRGTEPLTTSELECKEAYMRWLVQVAHVCLSRAITTQHVQIANPLTSREREVLQWTADGKSAQDIADILTLSKSAVDFHLKNVILKLQTTNKTAAVARAALLGWLS